MRISDWSSDVCSSDLPWPMGDKDATWPAAKGKTKFEQATADMARFGGRTSSLLIVKNGRIALERYWGGHDRSEEHTSELQSLMRISYAVFCLKKKKE